MNSETCVPAGPRRARYDRRIEALRHEREMQPWWPVLPGGSTRASASVRAQERELRKMRDAKFAREFSILDTGVHCKGYKSLILGTTVGQY